MKSDNKFLKKIKHFIKPGEMDEIISGDDHIEVPEGIRKMAEEARKALESEESNIIPFQESIPEFHGEASGFGVDGVEKEKEPQKKDPLDELMEDEPDDKE